MAHPLEFGLDTFGDVTERPAGVDGAGELVSHAQSIRDLVEQAVLADQVGLDFIGVGEHHRVDFAVSAPEVVLAAIAARTERIRLGSAVTVLSSDDPVRVYERFATVDALSNGRAEVILGRGSFTESFPLFGLDLQDYEVLFEEKIQLFAELLKDEPVTWQGTKRGALSDQWVYPRPESGTLKTWVGVGGIAAVGHPRGPLRPAPLPRDHRRPARPVRALRRPLPPCPRRVRQGVAAHRDALARLRRSRPTPRRRRCCSRTRRRRRTSSVANAAGPPTRARSTSRAPARRRPLRRLARDGRAEDRPEHGAARRHALRHALQHGPPAARRR